MIEVKKIEDIGAYEGPNEIPGIRFRPARAALGVSAWGMNVIELDPHCEGYPTHDHAADGQEEVYVVLTGAAVLRCGGEERLVEAGSMVRVPPEQTRQWVTRERGVRILALGGTPGRAYEPPSYG
jgi:mannose-6-phosphate isomerase-like protein (cupin superfamily)